MYQPKTGAKCSCRRGIWRDNCPNCEGTGWVIDFKRIRESIKEKGGEKGKSSDGKENEND